MGSGRVWGTAVVDGLVNGHPVRLFEPRCRSIGELAEEGRRWSDRIFLVQGERRFTFADALAAVADARAGLAARGVRPRDRVMILASNSPEWVVAFLAVTTAGAVAVPANRWWSEGDVAHAVRLTEPQLVVADERGASKVGVGVPVIPIGGLASDGGPPLASDDEIAETDTALILFTSGTTTQPKGVVLTHRSVVANIHNLLVAGGQLPHQIEPDRRQHVALCALPLFHISGIQTLLQSLVTGNRLVFLAGRFDPGDVLDLIEQERITHWAAVPAMAALVLDHPDCAKRDLSSLQVMFLGGAPVPPELVERVGAALPHVRRNLGRGYGSTEAGGTVILGAGRSLADEPTRDGQPLPLVEIRIDGSAGGSGELLVRSPAVMEGYLGVAAGEQPVDADGWLHTGDVARLDAAGFVHITDRIKDIIIRGGENIASTAVEDCLLGHKAVVEVAAVGLAHPVWGEEVGAVVRLREGAKVEAGEFRAFAAERLPGFAVPSRWWLRTEPLPLTETGKIRKADLKAAWPDGA